MTQLRSRVKVEGLKQALDSMKRIPVALQNPVLSAAVEKGAEVVRDDASQRAPRGPTGELQDRMALVPMKGTAARAAVRVGPSARAFYGEFLEKGTKHIAAKPFLRPALDSKRRQVINIVKAELAGALSREVGG